MKPLTIKDLPHPQALKLFELGYAAGDCHNPEELGTVLEHLMEVFPVHALACGVGRLTNGQELANIWSMPSTPNIMISNVAGLGWSNTFLDEYVKNNYVGQDGQFYECLRSQKPTLWIDVYRRQKHSFNPRTKRGFHPKLADMIFDYHDDLTLRQLHADRNQVVSNVSLAFRHQKEAYRFIGLMGAIVPHLHNAMLSAYGKSRNGSSTRSFAVLSLREQEVLKWLMEGKSNWEIGTILHISERTVKFHVQNLMRKLKATNRYHLVANAFIKQTNGLLH